MSVDQLHADLAGALKETTKELTDVLELVERVVEPAIRCAHMAREDGATGTEALVRHLELVRLWHVGSRHSTGIARRAGVMERYRSALAESQGTLELE